MNKDITLVILAAGMGSRFGGLKQIEPMGPNGEFIIDYSVYDAIKAGFTKIVFVIKEENFELFKETIGKRVEPHIKVEYAFQKNDNLKDIIEIPEERTKPFGTAHALLCAKEYVNENFAIISADDFYSSDAFIQAANYLKDHNEFCVIGYQLADTLSDTGSVKRGVCMEENGYLTTIIESKVERENGKIVCSPLDGREQFEVEDNHPVSMLMFGLTPKIFDGIESQMKEYLDKRKDSIMDCEFLLPDVLDTMLKEGNKIKVIKTTGKWYGVTYKEDSKTIKEALKKLHEEKEYPDNLWNK